jgi:prophage regulatory protein
MQYQSNISYLRIGDILGDPRAMPPIDPLIPVSKTTWWDGIREGRYPKPYRIGKRSVAWRRDEIEALLVSFEPLP